MKKMKKKFPHSKMAFGLVAGVRRRGHRGDGAAVEGGGR